MPVAWMTSSALLCCIMLFVGCRNDSGTCPVASMKANPVEIPEGTSQTEVYVTVNDPSPDDELEVVTELTAESGTFGDRFARETTYSCAHDVSGPVQLCVHTNYENPEAAANVLDQLPIVDAPWQKNGRNPIYLRDPLDCSTTQCTEVICPKTKNLCPEIASLTIDPDELVDGETATITVVAEDPDDNPEAFMTMLFARHGTIADPTASSTSYSCDPEVGGAVEVCVVASDGDSSCDAERCTTVRCPGDPLENTCPIIESITATPMTIPLGGTTTIVRVNATDPDDFPVPLRIELSAETGVFGDRFAEETTFTCGDSGPVKICAKANDGDLACNESKCMTVQCPSDIPANTCPQLFVINGVPRVIPGGATSTSVETRGQDTDGLPIPLELTLNALWGRFENTENVQQPFNVVEQNATYICDRPGPVEVCVDATDGACTKTLCDNLFCPDDVPATP